MDFVYQYFIIIIVRKRFLVFIAALCVVVCGLLASCQKPDDDQKVVSDLKLDQTTLSLRVGENATLVATVTPKDAEFDGIAWSSDKPEYATVDDNGKVTAVAAGEAVITAKAGVKSATCIVTVTDDSEEPVDGIVIKVLDVQKTEFTFSITGTEGDWYRFIAVDKQLVEMGSYTPETYLPMFGIILQGDRTIEWVDGENYEGQDIEVSPDRDYWIIAAPSNYSGDITGDIVLEEVHTPANESFEGGVSITLSDITSTSVRCKLVPNDNITGYYLYIRDKAWYDGVINGFGESMLKELMKNPSAGSKYLESEAELVWEDLLPETEYYAGILAIDDTGAESLHLELFTTKEGSGIYPELEVSVSVPRSQRLRVSEPASGFLRIE